MNETLAKTLSVCCYTFAGLPYNVVKLRLQTQGRERVYKGVTDAFVRIAKEEGVRALGKGGTPSLTGSLVYNPLASAVGGVSKKAVTMLQLQKADREDGMTLQSALESSITALFVSTVTAVPENIQSKLQFQRGPLHERCKQDPAGCLSKVFKTEGVAGLFRGYSSVLLRDVPASPIVVGVFHAMAPIREQVMTRYVGLDGPYAIDTVISAAIATATSLGVLYPADVVKAHMHTARASNPLTLREGFRVVFVKHGLRGFYRGGVAAVISGSLSCAAFTAAFFSFMPTSDSPS